MIRLSDEWGKRERDPQIDKAHLFLKPTANIINNERLNAFFPKIKNKATLSSLSNFVQHSTESSNQ